MPVVYMFDIDHIVACIRQHFLVAFHARPVHPQLLLMKLSRVSGISKKQAILNKNYRVRIFFEPWMSLENLIRKNEQCFVHVD